MISRNIPLRYKISSLNQLPECMSNNSRQLHIRVAEIINDSRLQGTLVRLDHDDFGTLFACLVGGSGSLLSPDATNHFPEFTIQEILTELKKYGFEIYFNPEEALSGEQLSYLVTLNDLGFDKIRMLNVYEYLDSGALSFTPTVVAFKIDAHGDWLNNSYCATLSEFQRGLTNGTAINVSAISKEKKFSWSWLTFVANIEDILRDNQNL